jgi:hypothetical protein
MSMTNPQNPVRVRGLTLGWGLWMTLLLPTLGLAKAPPFEQLVASSDSHVLMEWAKRYEHGVSVPQDVDRAIQLYCRAAQGGDAQAQYSLGWIYALGRAGKRNEVLAAAWLDLAAKQHYRQAESMLNNLGVEPGKSKRKARCVLSKDLTFETIAKDPGPIDIKPRSNSKLIKNAGRKQIEALVKKLAPQYGLSPRLVLAVIQAESNFNPKALSPKNAQGLMQLIPETAARFGVKDVWDPEQNVRGGMAYLRWLLRHFNGNVRFALAAYNAGEKTVERYGGVPPYEETQNYVRRITENLKPGSKVLPTQYGKTMDRLRTRRGLDLRPDAVLVQEYSPG